MSETGKKPEEQGGVYSGSVWDERSREDFWSRSVKWDSLLVLRDARTWRVARGSRVIAIEKADIGVEKEFNIFDSEGADLNEMV